MTFKPGCKALNRKLPDDAIVKADYDVGMTRMEMARKYGVNPSAVDRILRVRGWKVMPPSPKPGPPARPVVRETPASIVVERMVEFPGGVRPMRISLPRIPTIHGEYGAAG